MEKKENCHNSRPSNDIDVKLGPWTKFEKRNTQHKKTENGAMTSFIWFIANLEQCGSRISDAWSVKLTFSLTVTFCLTKIEKRTKNLLHSSYAIALSKSTTLIKKC